MRRITVIQLVKTSSHGQRYRVIQAVNVLNPKIDEILKEARIADLMRENIQVTIKPLK